MKDYDWKEMKDLSDKMAKDLQDSLNKYLRDTMDFNVFAGKPLKYWSGTTSSNNTPNGTLSWNEVEVTFNNLKEEIPTEGTLEAKRCKDCGLFYVGKHECPILLLEDGSEWLMKDKDDKST